MDQDKPVTTQKKEFQCPDVTKLLAFLEIPNLIVRFQGSN